MNSFQTEPIVLSGEQFMKLADSLRRPDKDYFDRRNAVFARMEKDISISRTGMDMEVEIPDLDLSFLDEMHDSRYDVCSSTIELCKEFSFEVNVNIVQNVISVLANNALRTVQNIVFDCSDSIVHVATSQNVYNQVGVDQPMIYIKNDGNVELVQSCKTEQISCAA